MRIVDGSTEPDLRESIIGSFRKENGLDDLAGVIGRSLIAIDEDDVFGIVLFRSGRVDTLYVRNDAPEDTGELLLRSVISIAMTEGESSLSIHSLDRDGSVGGLCRRMGFIDDGTCACSQREGSVRLRKMF